MKRTSFADWPCSIARTMEVLGDWWTPLILRDAFLGVRRFDDFQHSLGIGRNILTQRLRRLVESGLLEREQYQEHPARFEYRLTEKGRDFYPVLAAMIRWGDRWLDGGRGAPVTLRHRSCGHVMRPEIICDECRQLVAPGEVIAEPGPGFPEKLLHHPGVQARFGNRGHEATHSRQQKQRPPEACSPPPPSDGLPQIG